MFYNFLGGILENLDFPLIQNSILKAINSFGVEFRLKIAVFSHFWAGSDIRKNFFQFLYFWEI